MEEDKKMQTREKVRNAIAKILGISTKRVISEANLVKDLGADFLAMKKIAMAVEDITEIDDVEVYAEIQKVEDVFRLCKV